MKTSFLRIFAILLFCAPFAANAQSNGMESDTITVSAYPNPFTDIIHVESETEIEGSVCIRVYDVSGHLLHTVEQNRWSCTDIDLSAYEGGVYLLTVTTSKRRASMRILKEYNIDSDCGFFMCR